MELGKFGVFSYLDTLGAGEVAGFARKLELLGYSALWFPETFGRDPFVCAAHVLGNPERFILGMGVSGGPFMKRHGINYGKPLSHMREYLVRMREAPYYGPRPAA